MLSLNKEITFLVRLILAELMVLVDGILRHLLPASPPSLFSLEVWATGGGDEASKKAGGEGSPPGPGQGEQAFRKLGICSQPTLEQGQEHRIGRRITAAHKQTHSCRVGWGPVALASRAGSQLAAE